MQLINHNLFVCAPQDLQLASALPSNILVLFGEVHPSHVLLFSNEGILDARCRSVSVQKKTETLEKHRRNASKLGTTSSKTPVLGTVARTDLRGEEKSELTTSFLNPAVSPSLQARVNLEFRVYCSNQ